MKITLLIGLPGSGKTTIAKQIVGDIKTFIPETKDIDGNELTSDKFIGDDFIIVDDVRNLDDLPKPGLYKHIIITDVYLCIDNDRELALDYLLDYYSDYEPIIVMIFFENNAEKCSINSKYRDDPDIILEHINILAEQYNIPEGAPIHKIWQPSNESHFQPFKFNGQLINIQLN